MKKKCAFLTGRLCLISDWRDAWKLLSVWAFAFIGAMPDLYNGLAAMGWIDAMPSPAIWTIRVMAGAGILCRLVKQFNKGVEDEQSAEVS